MPSRVAGTPVIAANAAAVVSIGVVRAGEWASTVAETLVAEGRYGVAVGENLAEARRMLEETVAHAAQADPWLREHPPRLEWWGGQFAPASTPLDHPLVLRA
jgi:acetylornithine deacetylase